MGLFDLPTPLYAWLDTRAAGLVPAGLRLALWGALAAVVSMALYRWLSPQERIRRGKHELAEARRALERHAGDWSDARVLMRLQLRLAVGQVGRVGWPALVASLPVLSLLAWLSTAYGHSYPSRHVPPAIETSPARLQTEWHDVAQTSAGRRPAASPAPHIIVYDDQHASVVAAVELGLPVTMIHKRRWWNSLLGNPLGYLPEDSAVDRISVDLPAREYLPLGPAWLRGWEVAFFGPLLLASIGLKWLMRIE